MAEENKNVPSSSLVPAPSTAESTLPELKQSDFEMEKEPFVLGRYSHIYRGIYKGDKVVIKRLIGSNEKMKDQFLTEVLLLG